MNGLIVVDKAPGISSAYALRPIKRCLPKGVRIGHTGTLDPFASGVLAVVIGNATRLSDYVMKMPKTYEATLRFGVQTDTLDPTGKIIAQKDPGPYSPFPILDAIASQVGQIEQMPPAFSALKVDGQRAYKLARQGEEVELKARTVQVYGIDLISIRWPLVDVRVRCGSGTYIRSIARDIGMKMGLPASLQNLRRTQVGPFDAGAHDALKINLDSKVTQESARELLQPIRTAVDHLNLPQVHVDPEQAYLLATGRPIQHQECLEMDPGQQISIILEKAPSTFISVLAIADILNEGHIKPRVVFSASREYAEHHYKTIRAEMEPELQG